MFLPILLGVGIALYFGMTSETPLWLSLAVLLTSGLTTYYLRHYYLIFISSLVITIIVTGFISAQIRTIYLETRILPYELGPVTLQGRIVEVLPTPKGQRLTLEKLQIPRLRADHVPTRARIHISDQPGTVHAGDWVTLSAKLKPPPGPNRPDGFDFQRHLYFQKIGALGFSFGAIKKITPDQNSNLLANLRLGIQRQINLHLDDPEQRALSIAFLTGTKTMLDDDVKEDVRAAGLAHLLAISGLHIGLVSAIFFYCLRLLLACIPIISLRYPIKKIAALAAIAATLFFTLLTGASVPTLRAFMMCSVFLTGIVLDRKAFSMRTVAWAALVILFFLPESLMGASFQLSFSAVIALVAYYEKVTPSHTHGNRVLEFLKGVIVSSIIASLATLPFAAFHFNHIALYGVFANLLAIPLTVFWIMPLGMIALFLMPIDLAHYPLTAMGWGIEYLINIAKFSADLPMAQISVAQMPLASLVFLSLAGLIICLTHFKSRLLPAGLLSFGFFFAFINPQPDLMISGDARLYALKLSDQKIVVPDLRKASYVRDTWLQGWGRENEPASLMNAYLPCDNSGCRYEHKNGLTVILNRSALSLAEDCQKADVLITPSADPLHCPKPGHLISAHDLKSKGTHALYFTKNGLRIETVKQYRGQRPWTLYGQ